MKRLVLPVALLVALGASTSAEARLRPGTAQRYAVERMALMVPLYANPTPRLQLRRCRRVSDWRFACRFTVFYMTGNPHRGVISVVRHRRVAPGFTRLGYTITRIPQPPLPSLRRSLADYS